MLIRMQDIFGRAFYIEQNAVVAILPSGDQKNANAAVSDLVVGVNTQVRVRGTPDDVIANVLAAVNAMASNPPVASDQAGATPAPAAPRGRRAAGT